MAAARGSAPRPAFPRRRAHLTIVPAAEVAAAAVARTPARWHWDEKKEGSAAGSRECRARRELQPGGRAAGWRAAGRAGRGGHVVRPRPRRCPPPDPGAPEPLAEPRAAAAGAPMLTGMVVATNPGSTLERFAGSWRCSGGL